MSEASKVRTVRSLFGILLIAVMLGMILTVGCGVIALVKVTLAFAGAC